jgi:hypothetical protein
MSFILRWLGLSAPKSPVSLQPRRDVTLALPYDEARARVLAAIETTLGPAGVSGDPASGRIEARFGLVNSERVVCTLQRVDGACTHVQIEAHFPAGTAVPARSLPVDALAAALTPTV